LHLKFEPFLKPKRIELLDYTGRLVLSNTFRDDLNIESLKTGLYFITVFFENGAKATQKLEIK